MEYGGSQARGLIGAVAPGLRHNHSNIGTELHLPPTPQLTLICTFMLLFSLYHHPSPELFILQKKPIKQWPPLSLTLGSLPTTILSVKETFLGIFYIYKWNSICSFVKLISLSMMSSWFILQHTSKLPSFLRLNTIPCYVNNKFCLSIHWPMKLGLLLPFD